jgi:hypothetical protein
VETTTRVERPRGFWRRNLISALLFLSFLVLTVLKFELHLDAWGDQTVFAIWKGDIFLVYNDYDQPYFAFKCELDEIRFGGWNAFLTDENHWKTIRVPLWFPLSFLVLWIAFREWRRSGKKLYGTPNAS